LIFAKVDKLRSVDKLVSPTLGIKGP
jgi:hypothetical protein